MWKSFFASLCAAVLLAAAAMADNAPLRVGTSADIQPLAYQADGRIVGMEADFARFLEAQLGRKVEWRVLAPEALLPALARGEVDLAMSGLTITPDREKQVDFTLPYLETGQMAVIRTDDALKLHNPSRLFSAGLRVGFVRGSAAADYVKSQLDGAQPQACDAAQECLQALLDRRIDVFIGDAAVSWSLATQPRYAALMSLYRPLTEEFLAWAVAKDQPELREQLNQALRELKSQSLFEHILNRWIPVRIATD